MKETELQYNRAAQFYAFERRHDLFAITVSGFSCWRVMRNFLFNKHQGLRPTVANVKKHKRILIAVKSIVDLSITLSRPPRTDFLFKGCVSALRWQIGKRWLDPAIDPILQLGFSAFKIVEYNSESFDQQFKNAAFASHLEPSAFTSLGRLLGKFLPVRIGDFHLRISALLENELGLKVEPSFVRLRVSTVVWQARIYRLFLKRIRPRCVIVTDTGEYGLKLACSHLDIPFIEMQHGVFDAAHPDAVPDDASGSNEQLLVPDLLLTKGQFWIDKLKGYRQSHVAVPVGSAIIDFWRETKLNKDTTKTAHIVVTTQGISVDQLIERLKVAIANAPTNLQWKMSIKLHPVYDDIGWYREAFSNEGRVSILAGNLDPNIYELLAESDLHVSISSACHFDALALGKPTLMLPLPTHENLLYAVGPGGISLMSEPCDLWNVLIEKNNFIERDLYSRSGYVENVLDCISHLAKENTSDVRPAKVAKPSQPTLENH